MDSPPSIFRFNIDTQLTGRKVENFILKSAKVNNLTALTDVEINAFVRQRLFSDNTFICGEEGSDNKNTIALHTITHRQFGKQKPSFYKSIQVAESLSSVALLGSSGEVFVPSWFVDKNRIYTSNNQKHFVVSVLPVIYQ